MKIQLDTEKKTIKIESDVLLSKLVDSLEKLLPNGEWKRFTLETNTTISYWSSPVIYREVQPTPWWQSPWICNYSSTGNSYELKSGTYNVEM